MSGGKQYYCLIAGLGEPALGDGGASFDARAVRDEIFDELSRGDRRVAELFYGFNDIVNMVNLRAGRSQFDTMGNLAREQIEAVLATAAATGIDNGEVFDTLPQWMAPVVGAYLDPGNPDYEDVDTSERFEKALFESYYAECAGSKSDFLRAWSRFDRNLRNVIAAHTARLKDIPMTDVLVGSDDIVLSLERSSAADFSLKGELTYIDTLLGALGEKASVVEKEHMIDTIRWDKADELSEFDTFGMSAILALLVKIGIIHRWAALEEETGRRMYEKLVGSVGEGINKF